MKNLILSLAASFLLHGLIAFALIAYLEWAPHPDVLATLDLSSVELSFAEERQETAAVAPMPASAERRPPKPKVADRPPEVKRESVPEREIGEIRFPEPKEDVELKPAVAKVLPVAAPVQARIDAPPRPRRSIRPDYPRGARQRGEQGDVVVEIRVTAEGVVDAVKVVASSGFAELDGAAVRAVSAAKFSPARSGEDAVASVARLTLTFRLK